MVEMNFKGKTALITGGSRGIGKAICQHLLSNGCEKIYITTQSRDVEWTQHNNRIEIIKLQLHSEKSIAQFTDGLAHIPKIDIFINNAGTFLSKPVYELDQTHIHKLIQINLTGAIEITGRVALKMKTQGSPGWILNISSIAGFVSKPGSSIYSASKSGLIGFTRGSALDLAPYSIVVNALCPGPTETDMLNQNLDEHMKLSLASQIPMGRLGSPEDSANLALFLCSPLNTYITGQTFIVDGGNTIS